MLLRSEGGVLYSEGKAEEEKSVCVLLLLKRIVLIHVLANT